MRLGRVVALISGIGENARQHGSGQRLDSRLHGFQRVAVIGIARQRFRVDDELAPFEGATVVAKLSFTPNS